MSKSAPVTNGTSNGLSDPNEVLSASRDDFFLLPPAERSEQLQHKLRRIVSEMRYAERNMDKFCQLTRREKEIIALLVTGLSNPQISQKLFISRRTVEQHRKNINRKLNTNLLTEICVFAYAFDLV